MNALIDALRIYKRLLARAWHSHQAVTHGRKAHRHGQLARRSIT